MNGLYNVIFGVNKLAGPLLAALQIDHTKVPRFRDCFLRADGKAIVIYTRTGGNNRVEYAEQIEAMRQWPGYIKDIDDSFDPTYALFFFAIPEDIKEECKAAFENGWGVDPATRWRETLSNVQRREH